MIRRVANGGELWITALVVGRMTFTAFREISGDMTRFQSGRVNRGLLGTFPQDLRVAAMGEDRVEHRISLGLAEEPLVGGPKRAEVRHVRQPEDVPQIGPFLQERRVPR